WEGFVHAVTVTIPDSLDGSHVRIVIFSCLLGSLVAMVATEGAVGVGAGAGACASGIGVPPSSALTGAGGAWKGRRAMACTV
ncbi:MAG: hypothetical protein KDF24_14455, partial [Rhodocyclaceae bacterium]|nr:hypothetical protein [Rhodocyclaceae bacterium]